MSNEMGEMHTTITAKQLASEMEISVERVGQLFRAFRDGRNPHFAGSFNRFAELTPVQVAYLKGEDLKVEINEPEDTESAAPFAADVTMRPEQGPSNEAAPQGEKKKTNWVEVVALAVAFLFPTLASAFNTYHISHHLSKDWRIALFAMCTVTFTPLLFIVARMGWGGVLIGLYVVGFEGFCNASATYLSLMGDMQYILDGKRGQCSEFLQSVVDLTNSDHRPTAILLGLALAFLFAGVQLASFWTIRKRF